MHAAIRSYQLDPDTTDVVIEKINESFMALIKGIPGYVAYYVLDGGEGKIASVSIFEDEAGIEKSNKQALYFIQENLVAFMPRFGYTKHTNIEGRLYGDVPRLPAGQQRPVDEGARQRGEPEPPDSQSLQLLSIEQLCVVLGMGKSWVYRRIRSGELPSVRLGRAIKVRQADLEEYLNNRRYHPSSIE